MGPQAVGGEVQRFTSWMLKLTPVVALGVVAYWMTIPRPPEITHNRPDAGVERSLPLPSTAKPPPKNLLPAAPAAALPAPQAPAPTAVPAPLPIPRDAVALLESSAESTPESAMPTLAELRAYDEFQQQLADPASRQSLSFRAFVSQPALLRLPETLREPLLQAAVAHLSRAEIKP